MNDAITYYDIAAVTIMILATVAVRMRHTARRP